MVVSRNHSGDTDIMYNINKDYDYPFPGEGPFFTNYLYLAQEDNDTLGLQSVDWSENDYPYLYKHKERLITRFNKEYAFRELGQETETRWQSILQTRFDEVADHFNHMYKVFETNDVDRIGSGYKITDVFERKTTDALNTSDNRSVDSKYKDTPGTSTSTLNNPTTQNIDTTTDTYASNGSGNQNDKRETEKINYDQTRIDELNHLVQNYTSVDNEFIKAFENMFIGIVII